MAADAAPTTGHIRKRQYQPSITSFFNRNATATGYPTLQRSTSSPLSPPLPAETQASLLSVGMRVRKSVPEGYKTHKTIGAEGFPFPSTAPPSNATALERPSFSSQSSRELQPFCGLHKTGGWAQQESSWIPPSSAPAVMRHENLVEEDIEVPGMSISQATLPSTQPSFASRASYIPSGMSSKKRPFEEEIEDNMDAFFVEMDASDDADGETQGLGYDQSFAGVKQRPFAKPRRKVASKQTHEGFVHIVGDNDFDEAAFLRPPEGMDMEQ